jgi:glutaredoxin-related protein
MYSNWTRAKEWNTVPKYYINIAGIAGMEIYAL